ncbi:MAG: hypothetical protein WA125_13550 [Desulfosporosinus sp.]
MSKSKARRIAAALGMIVLVIGGYVGWQVYQGQQLANQYAAAAQKLAQGSGNASGAADSQTLGSNGTTPVPSSSQTSPSQASPNSSSVAPQTSGTQPNSSAADYKQLMANTYQQTLQAMQNVKGNTLALQGRSLSLSAYKAGILQSQATFSAAEAFVRANPPPEETQNPSYQEFLAGIKLAKEAMGVVLNGISSLSPSSLYAAHEMGKKAQQQVVNGYSHL